MEPVCPCFYYSKLGFDASIGMKPTPKSECDSHDLNHGCQVIGHVDTTNALKQKILKRKLLLSKRKLACQFPGLHTQTEVTMHLWFWGHFFLLALYMGS